jgi:HPt (histidine-containing phosphotransfer) domain-containing protein
MDKPSHNSLVVRLVHSSTNSLNYLTMQLIERWRGSRFQITAGLGAGGAVSGQTSNESLINSATTIADELQCTNVQPEDSTLQIAANQKITMRYCANDPEAETMVLRKFEVEAGQCIEIMDLSIREDNPKVLCRAAHALKCVSLVLFADAVARRAKQLELMGQLCRLEQAPRILTALRREVEQFVAAIPDEIASINFMFAQKSASLADQADVA